MFQIINWGNVIEKTHYFGFFALKLTVKASVLKLAYFAPSRHGLFRIPEPSFLSGFIKKYMEPTCFQMQKNSLDVCIQFKMFLFRLVNLHDYVFPGFHRKLSSHDLRNILSHSSVYFNINVSRKIEHESK